MNDMAKLYI